MASERPSDGLKRFNPNCEPLGFLDRSQTNMAPTLTAPFFDLRLLAKII